MLGHDGPPMGFWDKNLITDQPLERCPIRTLQLEHAKHPRIAREIERYDDTYYPMYVAGHLLVNGGISDQPARYLAIIGEIAAVDAKTQAKAAEPDKEK
jgi:hypothetical protein